MWANIKEEGLRPMRRNHIHCVPFEITDEKDAPGLRASSNVLIYINVPRAMEAGIVFYRSHNNVILTCGCDGVLPADFFLKAYDRHTRVSLWP